MMLSFPLTNKGFLSLGIVAVLSVFFVVGCASGPATPGAVQVHNPLPQPVVQRHDSSRMQMIDAAIQNVITDCTRKGITTSVSVCLRDFVSKDSLVINETEKYDPGSLMKLPLTMTFLKMAERNRDLLATELFFAKPFPSQKKPLFVAPLILPGHSYTINQLLQRTIINSDNDAAALLSQHLDVAVFTQLFTELGLPPVDIQASTYPMTAQQCSVFVEALYKSSYLNKDKSKFATSLLMQSNFKEGMVHQLPKDIKVAHKFGEAGNEAVSELSETGIVYLGNTPYALTIMTKGPVMKNLPQVLSSISKTVFDRLEQSN